ncbi:hypothetical protein [Bradyrhizobium sp.]|uniref:hypothetical protein n=1 Tax=Bradyrhizobium sp. TaxID=376 RepID=UPI0026032AC5|nr:hypothetical protein [Bradyrhizobium sp.]
MVAAKWDLAAEHPDYDMTWRHAFHIPQVSMTYLAICLFVFWVVGFMIFAGRYANFTRLLYNNIDPAMDFSETAIFNGRGFVYATAAQAIDPADLTEAGRRYQKLAIRDERLAFAWAMGGLILFAILLGTAGNVFAVGVLVIFLGGFYFLMRYVRRKWSTRSQLALMAAADALLFWLPTK